MIHSSGVCLNDLVVASESMKKHFTNRGQGYSSAYAKNTEEGFPREGPLDTRSNTNEQREGGNGRFEHLKFHHYAHEEVVRK